MRIWTQQEYETACAMTGETPLRTGDFRKIDFKGKSGVVIGPQSIIGENAHLGMNCEIGHHSEVGEGFTADGLLTIGAHCCFGAGAKLDELAQIGKGTRFGAGAQIGAGSEIGEEVELGESCSLFGVAGANGRTLMRVSPVAGRTLYAFEGRGIVYVCMPWMTRTLKEFEEFAADQAMMQGMRGTKERIAEGQQLLAVANYVRTRFALMGLCAPYRREKR